LSLLSYGPFLHEQKVVRAVNVIVYKESKANKTNNRKDRREVKEIRTSVKDWNLSKIIMIKGNSFASIIKSC